MNRLSADTLNNLRLIRQGLAEGFTQKEIADFLHLSQDRISTLIRMGRMKTGSKTLAHWVAMGFRSGEVR